MSNGKILVVDDDQAHAQTMKDVLIEHGFEVITAEDGGEAITLAAETSPDLVLLDIQLPVMDGYEVLEELKRRRIKTRVVMCSGYFTDLKTAVRCVRSGACDFVSKGDMDIGELIGRIKKYLIRESTLNLQVSDLAPIVEQLIAEGESLSRENGSLKMKVESLESRSSWSEVAIKLIYLVVSFAAVALLFRLGFLQNQAGIVFLLLFLFILLLIPTGQLKNISAAIKDFKAKIELK